MIFSFSSRTWASAASLFLLPLLSCRAEDPLAAEFRNPPEAAKPITIWQWMNGCVSKEGITADLESFKKAGLGGVQQFLIGGSESALDDPSVQVMNPKWKELQAFAIEECGRLNLTFGTHNSPGWSSSGSPKVKVEQSMQKLIWAKTDFTGPGMFSGALECGSINKEWNYYQDIAVLAVPADEVIPRDSVIDLSKNLKPDGTLEWNAPAGKWTILRFGHTTTGHVNGTGPISGQGLECDKMSREALEAFWKDFPSEMIKLAGTQAGKAFRYFEIDSYEAGPQDWTPAMRAEFKKRREYDLLPWLPALAGRTVGSKGETERFQYDWNKTITDLFAENYYGYMTEITHRVPGMELIIEPYATGKSPYDPLPIGNHGDRLMCEFWQKPATWGWDSVKPVASAAHRNGKNVVMAEAFTGQPQYAWLQDPFSLKSTGDQAFCAGVNQFAFHASAHNPWPDQRPGMTMGWWGTQFGPGQTWWEHGGPEWISYLTRCQHMLQLGTYAADLCYVMPSRGIPKIPSGYNADILGEQDVIQRLRVKDGRLVLANGASYAAMVLPRTEVMTAPLAEAVQRLVNDGATVIGPKPTRSPSLTNYPECDQQVAQIGEKMWGGNHVVSDKSPEQVLADLGIAQDVQYDLKQPMLWIHRKLAEGDVYFLSNQKESALTVKVSFRIKNRIPEFWYADTGEVRPAKKWTSSNERTEVEIPFDPAGSVFVVFRKPSDGKEAQTAAVTETSSTLPVEGAWQLRFPQGSGAPDEVKLDALQSWSENAQPGVKYFSGTATYTKDVSVPQEFLEKPAHFSIDLGTVKNIASVQVNGRAFPALWKPPYRCDISDALRPGSNRIEIRVTNLWPNRLIGDELEPDDCEWEEVKTFTHVEPKVVVGRPLAAVPQWLIDKKPRPSSGRKAFTSFKFFTKDSPLLESGLIGPVQLISTR